MKLMISMPMSENGWQDKYKAKEHELKEKGYDVIPLYYCDLFSGKPEPMYPVKSIPLMYLGNALHRMSMCDAVYFCKGWENARGCTIELRAAKLYDRKVLFEKDDKEIEYEQ